MGILQRDSDRHLQRMVHDTLAGRSPEALVALTSPRASFRHASFLWIGHAWEVRDLGSRNGTVVNGVPVPPGQAVPLRRDSVIELGESTERWTLVDDTPPVPTARALDGSALVFAEDGYLLLPSADAPTLSVYDHPSLGWLVESDDGQLEAAKHGQTLTCPGGAWRLHLASSMATLTVGERPRFLAQATLRFTVSADEEHVQVDAIWPDGTRTLPPSVHWYTVLLLARARHADAVAGEIPEREQGWRHRDDLCRDLRTTPNKLNVDVHRLRRMLARGGIADGATLLERRPSSMQIRLGVGRIELG